jgi:3-oxoacyl-[acyl-carrier protein] reductase
MHNIIVTGASRGLGLAIAKSLVAEGFCVTAIARRPSGELEEAMAAVPAGPNGGALHFISCDLSNVAGLHDLVRGIRKELGGPYGLVNNAGIGTEGLLATMTESQIERLIRVNTLSPILLARQAVRAMMADGRGGRIVNVGSIVAQNGYRALSVYSATKASLEGFTRSLAREIGQFGITVNTVAPGFLSTEMTKEMGDSGIDRIARRSALKRVATVEEVANTVAFLMSDRASAITGTVVTIDAGGTA